MGTEGPLCKFRMTLVGEAGLVLELDQTERTGQPGLSSSLTRYYLHELGHNGYFLDFRFLVFR